MAVPNGGGGSADGPQGRRTGWWGWNRDYGWDDQGCLGCGLAWWIVAVCAVFIFGFWGWGVPGWGGWGGWGWRHDTTGYDCPPPQTGTTNMQAPPGGTNGNTGDTTPIDGSVPGAPSR